MKWLKKNGITLILLGIMLAGLGLLLYPTVADYWNKFHQSRAIASYAEDVAALDTEDYEKLLNDAIAYNEKLAETGNHWTLTDDELEEYNSLLDVSDTGIMGYIEIDKINCYLPIYHGTDEAVLQIAVGHIEGSSLPVGGESTHCVLSGHRGLPSAKLFTNLDQMEIGDTFVIRTLDEVLTYEVDQILIVEPDDLSALEIEEGEDLCTLVTCTPYGINTHRLLVRGHRVANEVKANNIRVTADAMQIDPEVVAPVIAIPILLILIIVVLVNTRKSKRNRKTDGASDTAEKQNKTKKRRSGHKQDAGASLEENHSKLKKQRKSIFGKENSADDGSPLENEADSDISDEEGREDEKL